MQWLRRNPGDRILLSSQTHIALDNVLEKVAALDPSVKLIRIGRADDPKISEESRELLLDRRLDVWIAEVRNAAEAEMTRWAEAHGVDRGMVAVGMKVERLLQVLKRQENVSERIASMKSEREDVQSERQTDSGELLDDEEVEEETDELDSEIGALKRELQTLKDEERALREAMSKMKGYASELSGWNDVRKCRLGLSLLGLRTHGGGAARTFDAARGLAATSRPIIRLQCRFVIVGSRDRRHMHRHCRS